MFNAHFVKIFYKDAIALFCAASIAVAGPAVPTTSPGRGCYTLTTGSAPACPTALACSAMTSKEGPAMMGKTELWRYLRKGINYLEASGKEIPTYLMHPGAKAYGPLALSPVAIKDVKTHYPYLSGVSTEKVLLDRELYETFSMLYADLLLRHYLKLDYLKMDKKEVFGILEKVWFLGPGLYRKGHPVIASRELNAAKYINLMLTA